jgi:hypothetical protein
MSEAQTLAWRRHLATRMNASGVTPLCQGKARHLDFRCEGWTMAPEAVSCPACIASLRAREAGRSGSPPAQAPPREGFDFFECPVCGWSAVLRADYDGTECCPICAEDNGRDIEMGRRPARDDDDPEGQDERRA